jgi:hypothetical protein
MLIRDARARPALRQSLRNPFDSRLELKREHATYMKIIPLSTKSVQEIVTEGHRFIIPFYQRGYRWEADQVTALLDDLAEFEHNHPAHFYCLQPLVVLKRDDDPWGLRHDSGQLVATTGTGREQLLRRRSGPKPRRSTMTVLRRTSGRSHSWEVVDGQQRLTTIFLILRHLEKTRFQIHYERHPHDKAGLDGLLLSLTTEGRRFESPDIYFIKKAAAIIANWFEINHVADLPSLTRRADTAARFVWQELENHQEGIHAFTRLNAGKIRLKDSELIRALFLRTGSQDEATGHKIALRWDYIERRLQDPECWSLLNNKGAIPESRIDFIFRLIAMQSENLTPKDRGIFDYFSKKITESNGLGDRERLWQDVEDLFSTLEEWFEDNRLFHLVGFLIERDVSILQPSTVNRG